jgi:hypothetical protein
MTLHAILGLVLLNAVVLVSGSCLLWGIGAWSTWSELARLGGVAYLFGLAALGVLLVVELTLSVPFGLASVLATAAGLALVGIVAGRVLGRPRPTFLDARRRRRGGPALVTAAGCALAIVFLEALFRSGRLAHLAGWDAMAFWVPKGSTIYYFGGLDEALFRELPNANYPPLMPALEAAGFEFMGGAETVTLHLLFWFPLAGFIAAVAGLLHPRVPAILLWPALLLVALTPEVVIRALVPLADLLLDYFVALAALTVALWLVERAGWQLILASVLLSAAMLTKREGYMFAACVVAAALVVSWRDPGWAWPRLAAAAVAAFLPTLSWRIWFTSHGISSEAPESPFGFLHELDRVWPSLRLAVSALFDHDQWLVVMPLAVAAVVLAFAAGARLLPAYAALVGVFATVGFTWSTWAFTELPFTTDAAVNPITRVTGGLVLVFAGLLPLLLTAAWRGRDGLGDEAGLGAPERG